MIIFKKNFLNKVLLFSAVVGVTLFLAWYGPTSCTTNGVSDFDVSRDTVGILQNFKDDWYWLVAEGVQFDTSYMLETRSPNKINSEYQGKLKIKVIRDSGNTAAFITYYKLSPKVGEIQFVSVNKNFRGKGYGKKLVTHAVNDLFKMGCNEVKLTTRVNNLWAQRIYDRFGFVQVRRDDRFVDYVFKKQ